MHRKMAVLKTEMKSSGGTIQRQYNLVAVHPAAIQSPSERLIIDGAMLFIESISRQYNMEDILTGLYSGWNRTRI